ncbi:MAG: omptin family outer membrane protease [Thermodesulfobacteriota bacterium]
MKPKTMIKKGLPFLAILAAVSVANAENIDVEPLTVIEGEARAEVYLGTERWDGDNTYRIGHPVRWFDGTIEDGYFPFSELEFPADIFLGVVGGNAVFPNNLRIAGSLKAAITDPDDELIDRDWVTEDKPDQVDIYSNSSITNFDMYEIDASVAYQFVNQPVFSMYGGVGYLYQHWNYEATLINQYSPSGMKDMDYTGDGIPAISYKLQYDIPYLLIGGELSFNDRFNLRGSFSYSPFLTAEDTDHHLLRGKTNHGDMDGWAYMASLEAKLHLTKYWFLAGSFDYRYMEADGRMRAEFESYYQYIYGVIPNHSVEEELESSMYHVGLNLGYYF